MPPFSRTRGHERWCPWEKVIHPSGRTRLPRFHVKQRIPTVSRETAGKATDQTPAGLPTGPPTERPTSAPAQPKGEEGQPQARESEAGAQRKDPLDRCVRGFHGVRTRRCGRLAIRAFPYRARLLRGGRGRKRRQGLVGMPSEPVGDIEAMRGRRPCRCALCRMGCGRRGPGVLRHRGARSGAAVRTVGVRSVHPGGRPVMTRPREARAAGVRPREGVRRTVRPDEGRAERVMRAVVPPSGHARTTEGAVRRPVREAREDVRHPGEARRQLRQARRRPGTAGVTMVAPARSVTAAAERTTVGRKVVGSVLVEPVVVGSGFVLRIVVGLIALTGEVRGWSTGVTRRSAAAAEVTPIGTGRTTAATNRPVAMRERKPGATTVPLPCRAVG